MFKLLAKYCFLKQGGGIACLLGRALDSFALSFSLGLTIKYGCCLFSIWDKEKNYFLFRGWR